MFEIFEDYAKENKEEEKQKETVFSPALQSKVFVVSVGGSLFFDGKPNPSQISLFAQKITELRKKGFSFVLVCGGGKPARDYVAGAKALGANNFEMDKLGIALTRANAMLLINALEDAFPRVLTAPHEAKIALSMGKVPIFGGLLPSFTTDAVSALIAEALITTTTPTSSSVTENGAGSNAPEMVNLTNVDGVYSADPKTHSGARFFSKIGYDKLLSLIKAAESKPGQHMILDIPCVLILKRSKIRAHVMNGTDLENFVSFVIGSDYRGTLVSDEKETNE
jgi:uridylate kinase